MPLIDSFKSWNISVKKLQTLLVVIGMLIAAQMQYIQHGWVNPDTVLYFESARLIALGHWEQAIKVFNWPLYSALIAGLYNITGMSIHHCAQLLNVIFFGITTASFMKIIELGGGGKKVMLAGGLILFSSNYLVGDVLEMLMRDQGFWAFFLTALFFFIRFYQSHRFQDAIFWQISAIIATLFRIEGITYLILLPMMLFFDSRLDTATALRRYIQSNLLNLALIVMILITVFGMDVISATQLGRLNEVFTINIYTELTQKLFSKSAIMATSVLGPYLDEFAIAGLLTTFVYVILVKIILTSGVVNTSLALLTFRAKTLLNINADRILKWAAGIALLNMALIITKVFVLSGRYVLALSLIIMLFASFYLAELFRYLKSSAKTDRKWKWLVTILLAFMALSLIKNLLPKREGYNYQQDAVVWLKSINTYNKPVFYDDFRARYYAQQPFVAPHSGENWDYVVATLGNKNVNKYHFLMISYSSKHADREKIFLAKLPNYRELKRFKNPDGRKYVVIYGKYEK